MGENRIAALFLITALPALKRLHYIVIPVHGSLHPSLCSGQVSNVFQNKSGQREDIGLVRPFRERTGRKLISPWTSSWASSSAGDNEDALTEF